LKEVYLCFNFKNFLGLLYELLYGKVFGMEDIDTAVQVMLYEGKQSKDGFEVIYFFLSSRFSTKNFFILFTSISRIGLYDLEVAEGVSRAPK